MAVYLIIIPPQKALMKEQRGQEQPYNKWAQTKAEKNYANSYTMFCEKY